MSRQTTLGHFGFKKKSFPTEELLLPLAWIGREFYKHAVQYAYIADSVFCFSFSICKTILKVSFFKRYFYLSQY